MFIPLSKMSPQLQAHLRYPPDIFSIQSAIYGRYHLTNPQAFYAASNAWQLSPTAGAGPQSQALLAQNTYNNQGQLVSTTPARMDPQYQVYSLPGTNPNQQVFTVSDGFVPASQSTLSGSNQNFNLTAWMVGLSDPGHYGQLEPLRDAAGGDRDRPTRTPRSRPTRRCRRTSRCSTSTGPQVLLGETLMVPIANSMVYLRPLYVAATTNPQPQLEYVVAVLGKNVQIDTSLSAVLSDLLQTTVSLPSGSGGVPSTGTVPAAVAGYLQPAQTDYTNALAALKAGNLATFQSDIQAMDQQITQAQQVLGTPRRASSTTTTTTTPPVQAGQVLEDGLEPTTTTDVVDHHDGADEHRAQGGRHARRRRRWPRPQPGAELVGLRPIIGRESGAGGPGRAGR